MDERRIERALRSGPPFATSYQPMTLDLDAAGAAVPDRAVSWAAAAAVSLLVVMGAAIAIGSGALRLTVDETPPVLQSAGPSQSPAPSLSRVNSDDAWEGEVRQEPSPPSGAVPLTLDEGENRFVYDDPSGDVAAGAEWADLTTISMKAMPTSYDGVELWFDLHGPRQPGYSTAAYGVVVDVDGDGVPDYRIGMDNLDGPQHREWISDLSTGDASFNDLEVGYGWGAFGMWTDTYYPGQEEPLGVGRLLASLGAEGVRFYVWASGVAEDGTIVNDYAPDVGWFEFFPNRSCDGACPVPPSEGPGEASPSVDALNWTSGSADRDWPLPVRPEPGGEPQLIALEPGKGEEWAFEDLPYVLDAVGDAGPSAPGFVDITGVYARLDSSIRIDFSLAQPAPRDLPDPNELWVAYGLVVDVDGDGAGDLRLGMDNAPGGEHRAWWTLLATGETEATTGEPYGAAGSYLLDTFLPGETITAAIEGDRVPDGRLLFDRDDVGGRRFRFYVWASMTVGGQVIATDYAPDVGWIADTER